MYFGFSEEDLWQVVQMLGILVIAIVFQIAIFRIFVRFVPVVLSALGLSPTRRPFQTFSPREKRVFFLLAAIIGLVLGRMGRPDPGEEEPLLISRAYDGLMWFLQGGTFDEYAIAKPHFLAMSEVVVLLLLVAFAVMVVTLPLLRAIFQGFGHQFTRAEIWAFRLLTSLGFYIGTITVAT